MNVPQGQDIDMENEDWSAFTTKADEWLSSPDADKGTVTAVNALLTAGNAAEGERENVAAAVKAMLKNKSGNPFGRKGRESVLSVAQQQGIDAIMGPFGDAIAEAFDANAAIATLVLPHGRSKVDSFDGSSFAASIVGKAVEVAKSMAKANTLDDLLG
jgi:hypothetical protein